MILLDAACGYLSGLSKAPTTPPPLPLHTHNGTPIHERACAHNIPNFTLYTVGYFLCDKAHTLKVKPLLCALAHRNLHNPQRKFTHWQDTAGKGKPSGSQTERAALQGVWYEKARARTMPDVCWRIVCVHHRQKSQKHYAQSGTKFKSDGFFRLCLFGWLRYDTTSPFRGGISATLPCSLLPNLITNHIIQHPARNGCMRDLCLF